MNENDVAFFGELLSLPPDDVKAAMENGGLSEKVKALNLMTPDQVETLKSNLTKEAQSTYQSELVEKAKRGELDNDLYKVIKGASYEMLEKDLSKEYGIDQFEGVKDLVSKAISKNKTATNDKQIQDLAEKVHELQGINENLVNEKNEALKTARGEYEGKLLSREKAENLKTVPFDFSDVDEKELEQRSMKIMSVLSDVFDARYSLAYDEDKVIVKGKDGKIMQNPATLEPTPVSDVMRNLAAELNMKLKSPESGGQGGKSSGGKGSHPFKDSDEFMEYCRKNNIGPTSTEGVKLWAERRPKV